MSPTLQNTRAQRNAALARSSSSSGHVVNIRYVALSGHRLVRRLKSSRPANIVMDDHGCGDQRLKRIHLGIRVRFRRERPR